MTANHQYAHYDLGAGGRGVTTDCHDASNPDTTGTDPANGAPRCWAGGAPKLQGVSLGIEIHVLDIAAALASQFEQRAIGPTLLFGDCARGGPFARPRLFTQLGLDLFCRTVAHDFWGAYIPGILSASA